MNNQEARPVSSSDALRAKLADVNARSRRGRGQPEVVALPSPPCETCRLIKRRRYRAVEAGDRQEAARMAVAMGIHQREAH
ncbi:hypothetical protein ABZ419_20025 [Streptomyces cinnamoneus]|uniref:hypothetical protein n=1 Tax=Streptomyces cinnamoneus TaxID=53446 RepID=UPI00340DE74A